MHNYILELPQQKKKQNLIPPAFNNASREELGRIPSVVCLLFEGQQPARQLPPFTVTCAPLTWRSSSYRCIILTTVLSFNIDQTYRPNCARPNASGSNVGDSRVYHRSVERRRRRLQVRSTHERRVTAVPALGVLLESTWPHTHTYTYARTHARVLTSCFILGSQLIL